MRSRSSQRIRTIVCLCLYAFACCIGVTSRSLTGARTLAGNERSTFSKSEDQDHLQRDDLLSVKGHSGFLRQTDWFADLARQNRSELQSDYNLRAVALDDVFISVKTSGRFHRTRLQVILDTWFTKAYRQTFFFTDVEDWEYAKKSGGHLINTGCGGSHTRRDLSCKMGSEYDAFLKSAKKWWCHFDDDNYVNIAHLLRLLWRYDWRDDVYIGRPSLNHPFYTTYRRKKVEFWFATGGAGLCISSALANKMKPWCGNRRLAQTSDDLRAPDDCTLGFVINNRLGVNLTHSNLLHSHLESLSELKQSSLTRQVSLSYRVNEEEQNVITVDPKHTRFTKVDDPTRLKTLHCLISPSDGVCTS